MRKRIFFNFFVVFIMLFQSCSRKSVPPKADRSEAHLLEVEYILEHPEIHEEALIKEKYSYAVKHIVDTVNAERLFPNTPDQGRLYEELGKFYETLEYELVWHTLNGVLKRGAEMINALENAHLYGLDPEDYRVREILRDQSDVFDHQNDQVDYAKLFYADVLLSGRALALLSHIRSGRVNPAEVFEDWFYEADRPAVSGFLNQAITRKDLRSELAKAEPDTPDYNRLRDFYIKYHRIASNGGWPAFHFSDIPAEGSSGEEIVALKKRLQLTDDIDSTLAATADWDAELTRGIASFQRRMGLEVTGILDETTIRQLSIPAETRLQTIGVNLERMKWYPAGAEDYIIVNVPEFRLKLIDSGEKELDMKVIVGEDVHPTPIFSDYLEYVVFNPTWTVPYSISSEELLPKIRDDGAFLEENHYRLYDGWGDDADTVSADSVDWEEITKEDFPFVIKQDPGPFNALGRVKFMMPNSQAIYLHDTPADHLFDKNDRRFSHGCIRVESPWDLVDHLLRDRPDWEDAKIEEALAEEEPVEVSLPERWPVYILYKTAWVDERGKLNFRNDIYGYDSAQINAVDFTAGRL